SISSLTPSSARRRPTPTRTCCRSPDCSQRSGSPRSTGSTRRTHSGRASGSWSRSCSLPQRATPFATTIEGSSATSTSAASLLAIWGVAMLVLLETRDLGGGLLYFGIFLAMLYVATGRLAYVAVGVVLFLVGSLGVWKVTPHVQERVTDWRHPWSSQPVYCPN